MAGSAGRDVAFTWGGNPVTGVREKGFTANGAAIDVTDDDSAGWREVLAKASQNEVSISLAGVTKDDVLRTAWFSGARTETVELEYEDGGKISGDFFLQSYSEGIPYNGAVTFTAELISTGAITYTPPA